MTVTNDRCIPKKAPGPPQMGWARCFSVLRACVGGEGVGKEKI